MEVSVVIPAHNRAHSLNRALNSLIGQNGNELEVIVVDDASTDDTERVVKNHPVKPVYIRHDTNRGSSAARNTGIRHARGEFITFLDSDDYYLPGKIAAQLNHIRNSPDPDKTLSFCRTYVDENGERRIVPVRPPRPDELIGDYILSDSNFIQTNTIMVSALLARRILFCEKIVQWDDMDFCMSVVARGGAEPRMLAEPLAVYKNDRTGGRESEGVNYRTLCTLLARHRGCISPETRRSMTAQFAYAAGFPGSLIEVPARIASAVVTRAVPPHRGAGLFLAACLGERASNHIRCVYLWMRRNHI